MVLPGSPEGGGPTELLVEAAQAEAEVHHGHGGHSADLELLPAHPGSEHRHQVSVVLSCKQTIGEDFTITEKAPSRACLEAPTSAFTITFKTLLN